jgi:dimethylaniline monooxygenase (N-oxide forming)
LKVAIIGAGPSGLATCKTLRQAGLDARCFEAGSRVGGQWVIDNSSGMSGAYRSLRTNTNKSMSRYSDFPLPGEYPDFPRHDQLAAWFESYARHFDLFDHIALDTRVASIDPDPSGGFRVTAEGREPEQFDSVVIATGSLWDPVRPEIPGNFDGPTIHAKNYRDPSTPVDLTGKRVLVIGLGNSGCEIATELSSKSRVLLSARSGQIILPRAGSGDPAPPHPADPIAWPLRILPPGARDAVFRSVFPRILAYVVRKQPRPEIVGLPPSPTDPFSKRAVVNDEVLGLFSRRALTPKPDVRRLRGKQVEFADGSIEPIDAIVFATGYRFSLPFLSPRLLGVANPADLRLYQGIIHPRHRRLFVVGVMRALCGIWPYSEQQALWIADRLRESFALPSDSEVERRAYPILRGPHQHCQFRAHDLRRERTRNDRIRQGVNPR